MLWCTALESSDWLGASTHGSSEMECICEIFPTEFDQQHKGHAGQEFALIRLIKTFSDHGKSYWAQTRRVYILILESTGERENEYRRIGKLIVSSNRTTDGETDLNEINEAKWEWKKVRLI